MVKNGSEKKPRTRKKSDTLSASSRTNSNHDIKTEISQLIHFGEPFKCKSKTQKLLLNAIHEKEMVFGIGPAGVGKSYVAVATALDLIKSNTTPYKQIMVCKPVVDVDEELGFTPGTVREKMEPYVSSITDIFDKLIGKQTRLMLEASEILTVAPLAFMRGGTFDNTIFIMDEAQNMTQIQMKTLLTRIGQNSKFIILGDLDQSDRFKDSKKSGLYQAVKLFGKVEEFGYVQFTDSEDVVRNKIISKILKIYKEAELEQEFTPKPIKMAREIKKVSILTKILRYFNLKK
jgi:phosphate starvation-inducible protein PhoH and related proteins